MKKSLFLAIVMGLSLVSCSTAQFISDKEEFWYNEAHTTNVYFCKANKTTAGAMPQCFEAEKSSLKQR